MFPQTLLRRLNEKKPPASSAVVIDEDGDGYVDNADYVDLSQYERVTNKPGTGFKCDLGCDEDKEEAAEAAAEDEESSGISLKLADYLPSLPSFGSSSDEASEDSSTDAASALTGGGITPIIVVSVVGRTL